MDNNNQNQQPDQTDLSSQYNDILEKYSQQLAANNQSVNPEPQLAPPPIAQSDPSPPELSAPIVESPQVEETTADQSLPLTPVPVMPSTPTYEPVFAPPSDDILPPVASKPLNIFKILFFISLLVFLGVAGAIAYTLFFQPQQSVKLSLDITPTQNPAPTVPSGPVCQLNDKTYAVGESFDATDGCNTCSCGDDLMIVCTEKACPSVTTSATNTTIPKDWKSYSNSKYSYSFKYPANWLVTDSSEGKQVEIYFQPDKTKTVGELLIERIDEEPANINTYTVNRIIGNYPKAKCTSETATKIWCYVATGDKISILINKDQDSKYNQILDQILSTFKFNN